MEERRPQRYLVVRFVGTRHCHIYENCTRIGTRPVREVPEPGKLRICKYCSGRWYRETGVRL